MLPLSCRYTWPLPGLVSISTSPILFFMSSSTFLRLAHAACRLSPPSSVHTMSPYWVDQVCRGTGSTPTLSWMLTNTLNVYQLWRTVAPILFASVFVYMLIKITFWLYLISSGFSIEMSLDWYRLLFILWTRHFMCKEGILSTVWGVRISDSCLSVAMRCVT